MTIKDGAGDVFCGSIFPLLDFECEKIHKKGDMYIRFPTRDNYCCKCCSEDTAACSRLTPTMFSKAEYVKDVKVGDNSYQRYELKKTLPNYIYESKKDTNTPTRIFMKPYDDISFTESTFSTTVSDDDFKFDESTCSSMCPWLSYCSVAWLM